MQYQKYQTHKLYKESLRNLLKIGDLFRLEVCQILFIDDPPYLNSDETEYLITDKKQICIRQNSNLVSDWKENMFGLTSEKITSFDHLDDILPFYAELSVHLSWSSPMVSTVALLCIVYFPTLKMFFFISIYNPC